MKIKDIQPGQVVYHVAVHTWGQGVIRGWKDPHPFEYMFIKHPQKKVEVRFEGEEANQLVAPSDLRLTPNMKRIKDMAEFYKKRGKQTEIVGGRLILSDPQNQEEGRP